MTQVSRHLLTGLLALSVVTSVSICPVLADGKWEVVRDSEPNAKVHLNYVRFFDGLKGVAHGSGLLLMTRDGGQTWSGKEIYGDGMFVSPDTGIFTNWSADKLGQEITFTLDSGKNWESFRPELPDDLSPDVTRLADIYFVSSREGWAIAEEGFVSFILHTDDGGKTWEKQFDGGILSDTVRLYDLFFLDSDMGWACGSIIEDNRRNLVIGTSDGGKTWFHRAFGTSIGLGADKVFFLSPHVGWVFGDKLYRTEDGGLTWEAQFQELGSSIFFLNEKSGWILQQRSLLHTMDGGETWDEKPLDQTCDYSLEDICFVNENLGWVVGWCGLVMHTRDGGETWERQGEMGYPDLWSVDFVHPGWGVAAGREVLVTEDGLNWQNEDWMDEVLPGACINQVEFVDEQTGWLNLGGPVYKTDDGGETWRELPDISFPLKEDICFIDETQGWMLDTTRHVYHTDDGGITWNLTGLEQPNSIYFIDENKGWAIMPSGSVYCTGDGANKWRYAGSLPEELISTSAICFANEDMGWVLVNADRIYHTENGGKRWELDAQFPDMYLKDICYDGGQHLYAVGLWGAILRYTDPDLNSEGHAIEPSDKLITAWGGIRTQLFQNYPNPFNPDTWIPYQLAEASKVTITIYSAAGQAVRTVALGQRKAGYQITRWDGRDDEGQPVASGIYFYILKTDDGFTDTRKMVLLK